MNEKLGSKIRPPQFQCDVLLSCSKNRIDSSKASDISVVLTLQRVEFNIQKSMSAVIELKSIELPNHIGGRIAEIEGRSIGHQHHICSSSSMNTEK
jgi:hypothetical protein